MSAKIHSERKHSKFSASGSERWFNCPGSVELSEGVPDKSSKWSIEGEKAHEILEEILQVGVDAGISRVGHVRFPKTVPREMVAHGTNAANFLFDQRSKYSQSEFLVETRISLPFIHPEMFGTFDSAVVDHFGVLNVFDYKYGAGHAVSPGSRKSPNLQMLFYGIGLAARYFWNFTTTRLWIIQPRIRGYDGPTFLELPTAELRDKHVPRFERAVERVEKNPELFVEGGWCHWCKAKGKCPLKNEKRTSEIRRRFLES